MRACPLIVAIFLALLLAPRHPADQQRTVQDQGSKQARSQKNSVTDPIALDIPRPESTQVHAKGNVQHKRDEADPSKNWWIEFINAGATVVIAIFAIVAAFLAGNQIKTAKDIERSWLLVQLTGNPDPEWPYMIHGGYVPRILIRFKVFGKTPIHITDVRLVAKFIPRIRNVYPPQPNLPLTPNYAGISIDHTCVNQNGTMPPDAILDIHRSISSGDCDGETVKRVVKGDLLLCAYGRLMYKDNFGRPKETRVCYVYDFKSEVPDIIDGEEVFAPAGFRKGGTEAYNKAT